MLEENGHNVTAAGTACTNPTTQHPAGAVADLLQWKHMARARKIPPPSIAAWRDKLPVFSRKEKQAVLLGLLLSDCIRDDQLDAMIELAMR